MGCKNDGDKKPRHRQNETNNGEYIITEDGKTIEIINTSYDDNELVVFELKRVKGIYSLNAYYKQERMVTNA